MVNSKLKRAREKPVKPPGSPLFPHPSGQWARKIAGKLRYFGVWEDHAAALERHNWEYPYWKAGKVPPAFDVSEGCTLKVLVNTFLAAKQQKVDQGDLSPRTWRGYYAACEMLIDHFGRDRVVDDLKPQDFGPLRAKLAARLSPTSVKNQITMVHIIFRFASENQLIDRPVAYGSYFDVPPAKSIRRFKREGGAKLFSREEVLAMLAAADPILKAWILLGLNCGFGNSDVASLPQEAVDLESGWVTFARVKTEIGRKIPLWQKTVDALRIAIAARPKPADPKHRGLCFLTKAGRPWVRIKQRANPRPDDPRMPAPRDDLAPRFTKLLEDLEINGRRGLGFYTLRHTFATVAGGAEDPQAVASIMGHVDASMTGQYQHGVSDDRLRSVVDHVHAWLYGDGRADQ